MTALFHEQVVTIMPRLPIQAMALTRNRSAAEDLVQDAVCSALAAQASFIPGTNFPAWMHRIVRNRLISDTSRPIGRPVSEAFLAHGRPTNPMRIPVSQKGCRYNMRKRRDATDIDDASQSLLATKASHEDHLALKELGSVMMRLPAGQREALLMVVVHGMSYEALAEATGCAVGTAKSRVFRARRQLAVWLLCKIAEKHGVRRSVDGGPQRERPDAQSIMA